MDQSGQVQKESLARIQLVALDLDGVLTDGRKHYNNEGLCSLTFHARDGLGIYLLNHAGIRVALITNGSCKIVRTRAADLEIPDVIESSNDKGLALMELQDRRGVTKEQTLFIGDDLWDLKAFAQAAVRVCVPDAPEPVRRAANWIAHHGGGLGAVREVADALLLAKGIDPLRLLE